MYSVFIRLKTPLPHEDVDDARNPKPPSRGLKQYHVLWAWLFIVAIESCIDMCNHVIARNGYRVPEDYADTFKVMAEAGAFDPDFSDDLRNMARFRNRLVHLYWQVDDKQVFERIRNRVNDFKKFLDSISRFLEMAE